MVVSIADSCQQFIEFKTKMSSENTRSLFKRIFSFRLIRLSSQELKELYVQNICRHHKVPEFQVTDSGAPSPFEEPSTSRERKSQRTDQANPEWNDQPPQFYTTTQQPKKSKNRNRRGGHGRNRFEASNMEYNIPNGPHMTVSRPMQRNQVIATTPMFNIQPNIGPNFGPNTSLLPAHSTQPFQNRLVTSGRLGFTTRTLANVNNASTQVYYSDSNYSEQSSHY